jgi:signal transduction histidine kinase
MKWEWILMLVTALCLAVCGRLWVRLRQARIDHAAAREFSTRLLAAREQERREIAEELHDSLGQDLLIIQSRARTGLSLASCPVVTEHFSQINATCATAITTTRSIAHQLGPRYLSQLGLIEAVDTMLDRVSAATGLHIDRRLEPVNDLFANESATNIYRIIQESLNNIIKHAAATRVRVELLRDLAAVELRIEDNGLGFETGRRPTNGRSGIGLLELPERVRLLGGQLDLQSHPGRGTQIKIIVPCDPQAITRTPAPQTPINSA